MISRKSRIRTIIEIYIIVCLLGLPICILIVVMFMFIVYKVSLTLFKCLRGACNQPHKGKTE